MSRTETTTASGVSDLGELLFERQERKPPGKGERIATLVAATVLPAVITAMIVSNVGPIGLTALVPFALLVATALYVQRTMDRPVQYVHEHGLRIAGKAGERVLRFDDVTDVIWYSASLSINYIPAGSGQSLQLFAGSGPPVKFFAPLHGRGPDTQKFMAVMNRIIGMIRDRMEQRLAAGERVAWTSGYALAPGGLVTPKGKEIPWGELDSIALRHGFCFLSKGGKDLNSPISMLTARNLLPGYLIIRNRIGMPDEG
ncbi:MAG TPA: hypothetical protein VF796_03915 [Humisphaera sp.]